MSRFRRQPAAAGERQSGVPSQACRRRSPGPCPSVGRSARGTLRFCQAGTLARSVLGVAAAAVFLCGCGPTGPSEPPTPPLPVQPPLTARAGPTPHHYPTLCKDPDRQSVLEAYLAAWRQSAKVPNQLAVERAHLLALYADAYRDVITDPDRPGYDRRLRLLWDLCGVAHATMISPAEIKQAVAWQESPATAAIPAEPVLLVEARNHPLRLAPNRLPRQVLQLLGSVPKDAVGGSTYADYVAATVHTVYLTPQLAEWSPACPLDVCGSSEPLTRTLILVSANYVDLAPKPDWSLAAVAVHEAAHIEWFHRPGVSRDPRLLLPAPNERQAWCLTAQFLRALLKDGPPPVQPYVSTQAAALRQMLIQACGEIRKANRVLHLSEYDESLQLTLPEGISEAALRGETPGL